MAKRVSTQSTYVYADTFNKELEKQKKKSLSDKLAYDAAMQAAAESLSSRPNLFYDGSDLESLNGAVLTAPTTPKGTGNYGNTAKQPALVGSPDWLEQQNSAEMDALTGGAYPTQDYNAAAQEFLAREPEQRKAMQEQHSNPMTDFGRAFTTATANGALDTLQSMGKAINAAIMKPYLDVQKAQQNLQAQGKDAGNVEAINAAIKNMQGNEEALSAGLQERQDKYAEVSKNLDPNTAKWVNAVGSGMGSMVPQMALGAANPLLSTLGLYAQGAGSYYDSAMQQGASFDQAYNNAIAGGIATAAIEKIAGGVPFEKAGLIASEKIAKQFTSSKAGQYIIKRIADATGEGFEEVVENIVQPVVEHYVIGKEINADTFIGAEALEDDLMAAVSAAIGSITFGTATDGVNAAVNKAIGKTDKAKTDVQEQAENPTQNHTEIAAEQQTQQPVQVEETPKETQNIGLQIERPLTGSPDEMAYNVAEKIANGEKLSKTDEQVLMANKSYVAQALGVETGTFGTTKAEMRQAIKDMQAVEQNIPAIEQNIPENEQNISETVQNVSDVVQSTDNVNTGVDAKQAEDQAKINKYMATRKQVSESDMNLIRNIAAKAGRKVRFEEMPASVMPNGQIFMQNAHYDKTTSEIVINTTVPKNRSALSYLVHEMMHSTESGSMYQMLSKHLQESKTITDIIDKRYGLDGMESLANYIRDAYGERGVQLNDADAMHEAVAFFAEQNLFKDQSSVDELVRGNRTLGQKILDAIRDAIDTITGNNSEKAELRRIERMYEKALQETERNQQRGDGEQYSFVGIDEKTGRQIFESNFPKNTPKSVKQERIIELWQNVWAHNPITLYIIDDSGNRKPITAKFDPALEERSDLAKTAYGNRVGTNPDRMATLTLADDLYYIAETSWYNGHKSETGKELITHKDVTEWHYFVNDILYKRQESDELTPYRMNISVKEKPDGNYYYNFGMEKQKEATPRGYFPGMDSAKNPIASFDQSLPQSVENSNSDKRNSIDIEGISDTFSNLDNTEPNATVQNDDGELVAFQADNGQYQYNLSTWDGEDGQINGRSILQKSLRKMVSKGELTQTDADQIMQEMEEQFGIASRLANSGEYESYGNWARATVKLDSNGNPALSCVVPNGDYAMNIDFSRVCKKRATLNRVLNEMVADGTFNARGMTEADYARINEVIRKHGFEVACGLCFVDAKRYAISKWATSFADPYNALVDLATKEAKTMDMQTAYEMGESTYSKERPAQYDALETALNSGDEWKTDDGSQVKPIYRKAANLIEGRRVVDFNASKPNVTPAKIKKLIAQIGKDNCTVTFNATGKAGKVIYYDSALAAKAQQLINPNDMISSRGMDAMRVNYPEVYAVANGHMGTAKPKTAHTETPYQSEIIKGQGFKRDKAFAVGGLRAQSFSDYRANMFFDYMQAWAEVSAKKMPVHSYTKEPAFARLFGMTGAKINMSLLCQVTDGDLTKLKSGSLSDAEREALLRRVGLNEDGSYCWGTETFDPDEAFTLQANPSYGSNCGTIVVALSYEHAKKLLADPKIRMVIPYHKSGLNHLVAQMTNVEWFTDYTNYQNETDAKTGAKVTETGFSFYDQLKKNEKLAITQAELDMVPKRTAEDLVRYCERKGFRPRFPQFAYHITDGSTTVKYDKDGKPTNVEMKDGKTVVDENYYKVLEDFTLYDEKGHYAPQKSVRMNFPNRIKAGVEVEQTGHAGENMSFEDYIGATLQDQQMTSDQLDADMKSLLKDIHKAIDKTGVMLPTEANRFGRTSTWKGNDYVQMSLDIDPIGAQEFSQDRKKASLWELTGRAYFDAEMELYHKYQKGSANRDNFFVNTAAEFKVVDRRPRRAPDHVSHNKYGEVSSEYWYTKEGVIRGSDHWGIGIRSCDWLLDTQRIYRDDYPVRTRKHYAYANWSDFVYKTDIDGAKKGSSGIYDDFSSAHLTSFETTDRSIDGGKRYSLDLEEIGNIAKAKKAAAETDTRKRVADQLAEIERAAKQTQKQRTNKQINAAYRMGVAETQAKADERLARARADITERLTTKAEKEKAKADERLERARADIRERLTTKAEKEKAAMAASAAKKLNAQKAKTAAETQKRKDQVAGIRESRRMSKLRESIKANTDWLTHRIEHPTEGAHIPMDMVSAARDVAYLMNMETASTNALLGEGKVGERLNRLLDSLRHIETTESNIQRDFINSGLTDMVQSLKDQLYESKHTVGDMTETELEQVDVILKGIKTLIREAGTAEVNGKRYTVAKLAEDAAYDVRRSDGISKNAAKKQLQKWTFDIMTPKTFFNAISNWQNGVVNDLREAVNKGQRQMYQYQMEIAQMFAPVTDKVKMRAFSGRHADMVDIGLTDSAGHKIKLTHAQLCSLYMHLQNSDNADHILAGGLSIPDPKLYAAGKISEATTQPIRVRVSDSLELLQAVSKAMTDYDRQWCEISKGFFNEYCKKLINQTSVELVGFEKARVENYFPIQSDSNFSQRTFDSIMRDGSIEGVGFLKERKGGKNPILLVDINQVVDRQADGVSKYAGLAIPMRNFTNVWNATSVGYGDSLHNAVANKWGKAALDYVDKWAADVQFGQSNDTSEFAKSLAGLRGNYAQSVLTLNPTSALSQISLYSAAPVLGMGATTKALGDLVNIATPGGRARALDKINAEIAEHTPMMWIRKKGSTGELYDFAHSTSRVSEFLNSKGVDKLTSWISRMDENTIAAIWQGAKHAATEQGLQQGSKEYWDTVTDLFNRAVEETQPNYTPMQMSQVSRSKDGISKALSMFKSPFMSTSNTAMDAFGNYKAVMNRASASPEDKKKARELLAKTIASQLIQALMSAALRTAAAALVFHKLDDLRDDTGELSMAATLENIGWKFANNMVSQNFPILAGDIFSAVQAGVNHSYYSGDVGTNALDSLSDALADMQKLIDGGATSKEISNAVVDAFTLIGLPAIEAKNWVKSFQSYAKDIEVGEFGGSYQLTNANAVNAVGKAIDGNKYDTTKAQKRLDAWYRGWLEKNGDKYTSDEERTKKAESALQSSLTSKYKSQYIAASEAERKEMAKVLTSINVNGKNVYSQKDIDGWLK